MFLWIGCLGTLLFPIFGLTGASSSLWTLVFSSGIRAEAWFRPLTYLLNTVWFLFYVAYAVIGFGLWKLKNWARKAVLGLMALLVLGGLVVAVFFAKSAGLGVTLFGAALVEPGWMTWYLMRPRVRYAFGVWNRHDSAGNWVEPYSLSRRGKVSVVFLIPLSVFICFVIPLIVAISAQIRNSEPFKLAMATAESSPCVVNTIGLPLRPDFLLSGSGDESATNGSAELEITVVGPKGKGKLKAVATKQSGKWELGSLDFVHDGKRTSLVPPDTNSGCE
ncbi:MAG TPA: cytochrome c oxidase assembly factor Coa1 family protein [Terracidiphilus sp.]|nr:cytochrome c oxidase assembly factor Coa1 family protein [Terracidiphilus sp.]